MFYSPYNIIKYRILALTVPEAWGVYLNELLRRISTSMVGLFIPLYILKETEKIINIPIYYGLYAFSALLFSFYSALLIKKIGVDKGMALGSIFRLLFLYSLIFASLNHNFFWISAFFFGLTQPFDWLPHHYALAKMAQTGRQFSSAASLSKIVTRLGSTLGPIMGGFIIYWFGFSILYIIAGFLIIISALAPFLDNFEKTGMHVSGAEIWLRLKDPGMHKHFIVFGLESFESLISTMIWPVFLYTAVGSFEKTGSLETISHLVGILSLYISGKAVKSKRYNIIIFGCILTIVSWLGRIFSHDYLGLTLSNIGYFTGTSLLWVPVWSLLYKHSVTQKYTMQFWLVHHIVVHSLLFIGCLLIILALIVGANFYQIIFISLPILGLSVFIPRIYKSYIKKYA